jgi:replicative DNA helicase
MSGKKESAMSQLVDAEKKLLRAVIDTPAYIDEYGIREDFFTGNQKALFHAITEIYFQRGKVDLLVLLENAGKYGIDEALKELPDVYGNVDYYAKELHERAQKKNIKQLALWVNENLKKPVGEIIEEVEKVITNIAMCGGELTKAADLLPGFIATIERRALKQESVGIKTGYKMIDNAIGGLRPGRIAIIAARTGQGKSMIALNMIANMTEAGHKAGLFSCEMEKHEIIERLVSLTGNVDHHKLVTGDGLTSMDFNSITTGCGIINAMNLYIDDTQYIKISELKSKIRKMARHGVEVIFVDYLTLIDPEDRRLPRHERVGLLCKLLNRMSGEIKIPIVALSQLNRNAEGKDPGLADLRQSGEIEEDAKIVMMIWRENDESKNLWCELKKNGGGPKARFKLGYNPARMQITNEWF